MFKIQVFFKSNIKGVYSQEIDIATDEYYLDIKKQRMIDRWFEIICPHINFNMYLSNVIQMTHKLKKASYELLKESYQLKIDLINQTLDNMDKFDELSNGEKTTEETMRKFEITVEKI